MQQSDISKKNKDNYSNNNNTNDSGNSKEEVQAIKDDIQDIVKRLGNLKDDAVKSLVEESGQLMSTLSEMKDKVMDQGQHSVQGVARYVHQSPIQSLAYSFGIGFMLAILLRK